MFAQSAATSSGSWTIRGSSGIVTAALWGGDRAHMASPLAASCTSFNFILPLGSQSLENASWPLLEKLCQGKSAEREGSKTPTEGGRAAFLDNGQDRKKRKRKRIKHPGQGGQREVTFPRSGGWAEDGGRAQIIDLVLMCEI